MDKRVHASPPQEAEFEAVRSALAERVARWTTRVDQFVTPCPGLMLYRHDAPTEAMSCLVEPAIALTIQGAKRALLGDDVYDYSRHRFLLTTLDLPIVLQTVEASAQSPYLSLVLKLDARAIAELIVQGDLAPPVRDQPMAKGIALGETSQTLLEGFDRLVKLLDEPEALPVLAPLVQKEIFYRLLTSKQGALLWQIASLGSQSQRIARAIEWLKTNFSQSLRVEELAALAQMSTSRFHHHFHQLTSMSPLQFQKWLRLNEARRLMLTEQLDAATAAFRVGYQSPSQFSREYGRQFGSPPRRDMERFLHLRSIEGGAHS